MIFISLCFYIFPLSIFNFLFKSTEYILVNNIFYTLGAHQVLIKTTVNSKSHIVTKMETEKKPCFDAKMNNKLGYDIED